jgi:molybdopterin converting factor small subunit
VRVTVEWFGQARLYAGQSRDAIDVDRPMAVAEFLQQVLASRDPRLSELLLHDGAVSRSVLIAVNDHETDPTSATLLQDGDTVLVMPPISGG